MAPVAAKNMAATTFQQVLDKGVKDREAAKAAGYVPTQSLNGTSWVKPAASRHAAKAPQFGTFSGGSGGWDVANPSGGGSSWGDKETVPVKAAPKAAPSAAEIQAAKDAKERGGLKNTITLTAQELQAAFDAIFGNLDNLLKARAGEVESGYGEKFNQIANDFAASLPAIEGSYAAVGADSSTDLRDANIKADEGFKKANKELETNKQGDLAKIGQYGIEQKAKYTADRDSVNRVAGRVGEVQDLGELRQTRNDFENKLGSVRADMGTLNTDEGARGKLSELTGDKGRFDSVKNALDSIVKGSMSGAVKEAAVKAVADSAGLSDEDKKKIQAQYGNTFAEQAAL